MSKIRIFLNNENIIKDFNNNLTILNIAKKYNCSVGPIRRILKENNLIDIKRHLVGKYIRSEEEKDKIRQKKVGVRFSDEINKKKGRLGHSAYPHQIEVAKSLTGEKHWHWKGGIGSPRRMLINRIEYKEFRDKIFQRDNYTCQICGKNKCYVHMHHKIPQSIDENLIMNENNVITLCVQCHCKQHPDINIMKSWINMVKQ